MPIALEFELAWLCDKSPLVSIVHRVDCEPVLNTILSVVPTPEVLSKVSTDDAVVPPITKGDVIPVVNVGDVPKTNAPEPVAPVTADARLADDGVASQVATPVPRPVMPPTGIAAAVIEVLQPNPVLVVQIKALDALLHDPTANAVGAADPAVALPTTVLVACVAKFVRATAPTVKAAPELACCNTPEVPVKSVVPSGHVIVLFVDAGAQDIVPVTPALWNTSWLDVPESFAMGVVISVTNVGDVCIAATVPVPVSVYSPTTPALSYRMRVDVPEVIVVVPIIRAPGAVHVMGLEPPPPEVST